MAWTGLIGTAALVVAAIAVFLAWHANRIANKSSQLATEANRRATGNDWIAREGNDVTTRTDAWTVLEEDCVTEGNDVVWEPEWDKETATFTVTNIGQDTADDVSVVLTVDDEQQSRELAEVLSGDSVLFDLKDEAEEAHNGARIAMEQAQIRGFAYVASSNLKIGARITWRARSGLPHVHDLLPHSVPTSPVRPR